MKAYRHNYHVEIIEPSTPWKNNARMLSTKNRHDVPLQKVKQLLEDYDKLSDHTMLLEQCRKEVDNMKSTSPPRPKPGAFLANFEEILARDDWSIPDIAFQEAEKPKPPTTSFFADFEKKDNMNTSPVLFTLEENNTLTETEKTFKKQSSKLPVAKKAHVDLKTPSHEEISFERIEESKSLLQSMFPKISEEIILDFLIKYENDVDTVTNILLDSVDLNDDSPSENAEMKPQPPPPPIESKKGNQIEANSPVRTRKVKSLQEICLEVMDRLERSLEEHFYQKAESLPSSEKQSPNTDFSTKHSINRNKNKTNNNNNNNNSKNDKRSRGTGKKNPNATNDRKNASKAQNKVKLVDYDEVDDDRSSVTKASTQDSFSVADDANENDDEPILDLSLNKNIIMSLIELFGDKSDLQYLKGKN
jgi:hypothetical protein